MLARRFAANVLPARLAMKRPRPRKSAPGGSKIEARGGQNGLLEGFRGWKDRALKAKAVFEAILAAILTPPGASKIDKKSLKMGSKLDVFFETRFEAFLKPPGRLLASILGAFWA